MYEHAPTPWVATKAYGDWNVYDRDDKLVAALHVNDEQKAAAQLLAAAPEMLQALHKIAELCEAYGPVRKVEIQKILRAAIAKAEGK
jgi:hypothetical protein